MKNFAIGLLVITGLALAGSEGPFFPWPNLAGGLLLIIAITGLTPRQKGARR